MINKDYLKAIFMEKKDLLKMADLRMVNMPKFDELSVKQIWPLVQKDAELMKYFPDQHPDMPAKLPDRTYMFNILQTKRPTYVQKLLSNAQSQRSAVHNDN